MNNSTPHLVKFSGGRSSGMMLFNLLKAGKLNPERGDVIVFNNTSAEHQATYKFAQKMKALAEREYNIPFFWIEYQTYEDASGAYRWTRKPSYKLVNDLPHNKNNPNGYRYKGEVFEELISQTGFLPSMMTRTCTQSMKIFITNNFLADWFAQKQGIERLGHYGDHAKMGDEDIIAMHKKSGGSVPDPILLSKREFVRSCDFVRHQQDWADFTNADIAIDNAELKKSVLGGKAQLYGDLAINYASCLGIRADEKIRVKKIIARVDAAKLDNSKSLFNQPPKEHIFAPLADNGTTQQAVIDFWHKQDFNLDLADSGLFSNCVYCPIKGKNKLLKIAQDEQTRTKPSGLTPASIQWWANIEAKYSRDLNKEKRKIRDKKVKFVGFFGGTDKMVYSSIKEQSVQNTTDAAQAEFLEDEDYTTCNCTD